MEACNKTDYKISFDRLPHVDSRTSAVKIRFNTHLVEHVEEVLTYDEQSLIAEVGGTMGMYLGASALSIIEVLLIKGCELIKKRDKTS